MPLQINNFCIIGLGLIGGSYAMALSEKGKNVTAIDINADAVEFACKHNLIKSGATPDDSEKAHKLISNADVIVLALYPKACVEWAKKNHNLCKKNAIITDVCGVKEFIVEQIQSFLRDDLEFISAHPMAGKEVSGVENANSAIFKNANFIVVPSEKNTQSGINFVKELGQTLGFARITTLSPKEHDKMIAYLSQLTHAIAVSLMNSNNSDNLAHFTGDSFRDLTRIARLNAPMWRELFFENSEYLLNEIDAFSASLEQLKKALQEKNATELENIFKSSTQRRAFFDKQ